MDPIAIVSESNGNFFSQFTPLLLDSGVARDQNGLLMFIRLTDGKCVRFRDDQVNMDRLEKYICGATSHPNPTVECYDPQSTGVTLPANSSSSNAIETRRSFVQATTSMDTNQDRLQEEPINVCKEKALNNRSSTPHHQRMILNGIAALSRPASTPSVANKTTNLNQHAKSIHLNANSQAHQRGDLDEHEFAPLELSLQDIAGVKSFISDLDLARHSPEDDPKMRHHSIQSLHCFKENEGHYDITHQSVPFSPNCDQEFQKLADFVSSSLHQDETPMQVDFIDPQMVSVDQKNDEQKRFHRVQNKTIDNHPLSLPLLDEQGFQFDKAKSSPLDILSQLEEHELKQQQKLSQSVTDHNLQSSLNMTGLNVDLGKPSFQPITLQTTDTRHLHLSAGSASNQTLEQVCMKSNQSSQDEQQGMQHRHNEKQQSLAPIQSLLNSLRQKTIQRLLAKNQQQNQSHVQPAQEIHLQSPSPMQSFDDLLSDLTVSVGQDNTQSSPFTKPPEDKEIEEFFQCVSLHLENENRALKQQKQPQSNSPAMATLGQSHSNSSINNQRPDKVFHESRAQDSSATVIPGSKAANQNKPQSENVSQADECQQQQEPLPHLQQHNQKQPGQLMHKVALTQMKRAGQSGRRSGLVSINNFNPLTKGNVVDALSDTGIVRPASAAPVLTNTTGRFIQIGNGRWQIAPQQSTRKAGCESQLASTSVHAGNKVVNDQRSSTSSNDQVMVEMNSDTATPVVVSGSGCGKPVLLHGDDEVQIITGEPMKMATSRNQMVTDTNSKPVCAQNPSKTASSSAMNVDGKRSKSKKLINVGSDIHISHDFFLKSSSALLKSIGAEMGITLIDPNSKIGASNVSDSTSHPKFTNINSLGPGVLSGNKVSTDNFDRKSKAPNPTPSPLAPVVGSLPSHGSTAHLQAQNTVASSVSTFASAPILTQSRNRPILVPVVGPLPSHGNTAHLQAQNTVSSSFSTFASAPILTQSQNRPVLAPVVGPIPSHGNAAHFLAQSTVSSSFSTFASAPILTQSQNRPILVPVVGPLPSHGNTAHFLAQNAVSSSFGTFASAPNLTQSQNRPIANNLKNKASTVKHDEDPIMSVGRGQMPIVPHIIGNRPHTAIIKPMLCSSSQQSLNIGNQVLSSANLNLTPSSYPASAGRSYVNNSSISAGQTNNLPLLFSSTHQLKSKVQSSLAPIKPTSKVSASELDQEHFLNIPNACASSGMSASPVSITAPNFTTSPVGFTVSQSDNLTSLLQAPETTNLRFSPVRVVPDLSPGANPSVCAQSPNFSHYATDVLNTPKHSVCLMSSVSAAPTSIFVCENLPGSLISPVLTSGCENTTVSSSNNISENHKASAVLGTKNSMVNDRSTICKTYSSNSKDVSYPNNSEKFAALPCLNTTSVISLSDKLNISNKDLVLHHKSAPATNSSGSVPNLAQTYVNMTSNTRSVLHLPSSSSQYSDRSVPSIVVGHVETSKMDAHVQGTDICPPTVNALTNETDTSTRVTPTHNVRSASSDRSGSSEKEAVRELLSIVTRPIFRAKFLSPRFMKKDVWREIGQQMVKKGYRFEGDPGEKCAKKWRDLMYSFRSYEMSKMSSEHRFKAPPEFYLEMNAMLKESSNLKNIQDDSKRKLHSVYDRREKKDKEHESSNFSSSVAEEATSTKPSQTIETNMMLTPVVIATATSTPTVTSIISSQIPFTSTVEPLSASPPENCKGPNLLNDTFTPVVTIKPIYTSPTASSLQQSSKSGLTLTSPQLVTSTQSVCSTYPYPVPVSSTNTLSPFSLSPMLSSILNGCTSSTSNTSDLITTIATLPSSLLLLKDTTTFASSPSTSSSSPPLSLSSLLSSSSSSSSLLKDTTIFASSPSTSSSSSPPLSLSSPSPLLSSSSLLKETFTLASSSSNPLPSDTFSSSQAKSDCGKRPHPSSNILEQEVRQLQGLVASQSQQIHELSRVLSNVQEILIEQRIHSQAAKAEATKRFSEFQALLNQNQREKMKFMYDFLKVLKPSGQSCKKRKTHHDTDENGQ